MKWVLAHPPLDDPRFPIILPPIWRATWCIAVRGRRYPRHQHRIRELDLRASYLRCLQRGDGQHAIRFRTQGALSFEEQEEYLGIWRQKPPSFEALER